jgi:hypothetical protein
MNLTPAQLGRFWQLFGKAWRVYAAACGEHQDDHCAADVWRKSQLAECGFLSLKEVDRTHGYDAVMLHFAMVANDDRAIAYFAPAVERRMRHLIGKALDKLGQLEGRSLDWTYAQAILSHMNLPTAIEDVPAEQLRLVLQVLDTHRRRIKASRGDLSPRKGNDGLGARRWHQEPSATLWHQGAA